MSNSKINIINNIIIINNKKYYNNTKFLLEIKESQVPNAGLGLFTKQKIRKNQLIGTYGGTLIKVKKEEYDPDYSIEINSRYVIDGSKYPRPFTSIINDAINSSFTNNCEFIIDVEKKQAELRATRTIKEGEELFIDYGEEYWTTRQ